MRLLRTLVLCLLIVTTLRMDSFAAAPSQVTVQGKLTNAGGAPLSAGIKQFTFKIYDAATNGNEVWPGGAGESQYVISDAAGLWTATLGAVTPLTDPVFADSVRWLEIRVTDGIIPLTTLPRVRLVTGPYAHRVSTVDGASGGSILGSLSVGGLNYVTGFNSYAFGSFNTASGIECGVAGGRFSRATGQGAFVGCGFGDTASADYATVGGGLANRAAAQFSTVGGGSENKALGLYGTVSGGRLNTASGQQSTVGAGVSNTALGNWTVVAGGKSNQATSDYASVGGGNNNTASGTQAHVGGGYTNTASGQSSGVLGGEFNIASSTWASIGGGYGNQASSNYAAIGGGVVNSVLGEKGYVGGGYNNSAGGTSSAVVGGEVNSASGFHSFAGGGNNNWAKGFLSTIAGGDHDTANGAYSAVLGGTDNYAGDYATVGGGSFNRAAAHSSSIGGGYSNTTTVDYATVAGGYSNDARAQYSFIGGGVQNQAYGRAACVPGGEYNQADSTYCFAAGYWAVAQHPGCFVWGDSSDYQFASTADNQFLIRARGGVGIGTNAPECALHVFQGEAGTTAHGNAVAAFESNTHGYLDILTPSSSESGVLFGNPIGPADGGVIYNNTNTPRGLQFRTGGNLLRMSLSSAGQLTVTGNVCAANIVCPSDERLKEDVHSISKPLDRIEALRGVEYRWRPEAMAARNLPTGPQIGLLAQEVQKVVPQAVMKMEDGYLGVDYARLVPLLIEGMKVQQDTIDSLRARMEKLETRPGR